MSPKLGNPATGFAKFKLIVERGVGRGSVGGGGAKSIEWLIEGQVVVLVGSFTNPSLPLYRQ